MLLGGLLMAAIPFAVYMGGSIALGIIDPTSTELLTLLIVSTLFISFCVNIGIFSAIQYNSCGKVKNTRQIAGNAGLSTLIIFISLLLAIFVPGLKKIVTNLFSPTTDQYIVQSFGYAYFLFWGTIYGIVTGGFLSSNCGDDITKPTDVSLK
jgi:F0F1-type ATP synthase membrane subunit a